VPVGPLQQPPITNAPAIPTEALENTQEFRYDQLGFPCVQTSLEIRQDLTVHKFADRDGAHVEACGRHPVEISARIPFFNGLIPGPQETWNGNDLYPNTWRLFLLKALDRSSKVLNHPELGPLTVKLQTCKTDWNSNTRNGVWVDVKWIESDDTATELETDIASQGANSAALQAASDLDANQADPETYQIYGIPQPATSFTALVQQAQSAITAGQFISQQTQGAINNMINQAVQLEMMVLAATTSPYPAALLWPLTQSAEQLRDAAYVMQQQLLQSQPAVSLFTTTFDATVARVCNQLGMTVDDFSALNPSLIYLPFIPQGTVVQYYTVIN